MDAFFFFFSSRRRHTRCSRDWSSDVCSSDLVTIYRVVVTEGRMPVHTLLLAGVIINAIISALILFITSVSDSTSAFRMFFWLMGNLTTLGYAGLGALAVLVAVGIGLLGGQARNLRSEE